MSIAQNNLLAEHLLEQLTRRVYFTLHTATGLSHSGTTSKYLKYHFEAPTTLGSITNTLNTTSVTNDFRTVPLRNFMAWTLGLRTFMTWTLGLRNFMARTLGLRNSMTWTLRIRDFISQRLSALR